MLIKKERPNKPDFEVVFPLSPDIEIPPPPPEGDKIILESPKGSVVTTNFLKNLPSDTLIHQLADTEDYNIAYFRKGNSFIISLFNTPFGTSRKNAEQELLSKLGISQQEACNLSIRVTVPQSYDLIAGTNYSGRDLGLSFCPGSIQL